MRAGARALSQAWSDEAREREGENAGEASERERKERETAEEEKEKEDDALVQSRPKARRVT